MAEVHRRVHSGDEEGRRPVDEFCWHPERGIQQQQQQQLCHADGYADQENDDITQFRTERRRGKRSVTWYDHLHGGPRTPPDGEYHKQTRSNVFEGKKAYEELEWGRAWQGQRQEGVEEGIRDSRGRPTQMGVSCARGACPYSTAGMTVPDDLKEGDHKTCTRHSIPSMQLRDPSAFLLGVPLGIIVPYYRERLDRIGTGAVVNSGQTRIAGM